MIKEAIVKIVNKEDLTYDEAYAVMNEIMSGETTPTQNAAFLAALSTKSARAETTDEIAGCAAAMRDHATRVDTGMDILEIVGTGGYYSRPILYARYESIVPADVDLHADGFELFRQTGGLDLERAHLGIRVNQDEAFHEEKGPEPL